MKLGNIRAALRCLAWQLGIRRTENRCPTCQDGRDCPAYNTGVIYPCPYYKKKEED